MPKLTLLRGLPASGKSTWAKEQVTKNPHGIVRVNNDELRETFNMGVFGKNNEKHIGSIRDMAVKTYLSNGYNVILDNTNLNPVHEEQWKGYCKENGIQFVIKNFDASVEECIERDSKRLKPVGEQVIRDMYEMYLNPQKKSDFQPVTMNENNKMAVVCDIDGTIAKMGDRIAYDYFRVSEDTPQNDIIEIIEMLNSQGYQIVFVSGRSDICKRETIEWLEKYFSFPIEYLFMRKEGDRRKDDIIKYEILKTKLVSTFYIRYWFDDRDRVVKAIREAGIRVLQVANGAF